MVAVLDVSELDVAVAVFCDQPGVVALVRAGLGMLGTLNHLEHAVAVRTENREHLNIRSDWVTHSFVTVRL